MRSEEQLTIVLINQHEFKNPTQRKRKVTDIRPKRVKSGRISGGTGAILEVERRGYRLMTDSDKPTLIIFNLILLYKNGC